MTTDRTGYRPDIDGLRALAVLSVIAYHFSDSFLPGGYLGVDIFFVISGFVITNSISSRPDPSLASFLSGFYARRFRRLLPALFCCVFVTAMFGALFVSPDSPDYGASLGAAKAALFGFSNITFYKTATNYFGTSAQLNLFTHTWSLGVEEQFYLLYPLLFWITRFRRDGAAALTIKVVGVLACASFLFYAIANQYNQPAAYFLMPSRFWELGAGCIAYFVHERELLTPRIRQTLCAAAFLILLAVLAIPYEGTVVKTAAAVLATAVLLCWLEPGSFLYRAFTDRSVVFIGKISYSLYLWHWSVIAISRWTIGLSPETYPFQIALIFALAVLSYYLVEQPIRFTLKPKRNLTVIAQGVSAILIGVLAFNFSKHHRGAIYLGEKPPLIANGGQTLLDDKFADGQLIWSPKSCALKSAKDVGKQIAFDTCRVRTEGTSPRQFLVIGNSFSASEFEMYQVIPQNNLGSVILTSSWGALPIPDIKDDGVWTPSNTYYWNAIVPSLIANLRAGDFLMMIFDIAPAPTTSEEAVKTLRNGLLHIASEMKAKGVTVIFQSANPFAREFGCTPDMAKPQWFNARTKPPCNYYTRAYSLERRSKIYNALLDVERQADNFFVLDLFDNLCPGEVCSYFHPSGAMLYRDISSHLSVEANLINRKTFLAVVQRALGRSKVANARYTEDIAYNRADPLRAQ